MSSQIIQWIILFIVLIGCMYFMTIRPQRKQEEALAAMRASLKIGDSIKTASGFYVWF